MSRQTWALLAPMARQAESTRAVDVKNPISRLTAMLVGILFVAMIQLNMTIASIKDGDQQNGNIDRRLLLQPKQQSQNSRRTEKQEQQNKPVKPPLVQQINLHYLAGGNPSHRNIDGSQLESKSIHTPLRANKPFDDLSPALKIDAYYVPSKTFAACVITMDDNHFWPEWLAYHFTTLPLRRLIVTLDPKATISPDYILNRFHNSGLVNVTLWQRHQYNFDDQATTEKTTNRFTRDYGHKVDAAELQHKIDVEVFYRRQRAFYATCLRQLQSEGHSWVSTLDMDEYLVYNRVDKVELPQRLVHERPTFLEVLNDADNRASNERLARACVPLSRLNYGSHEEPEKFEPDSMYNTSNLMTFRWQFHDDPMANVLLGKSLVDVSRINRSELRQSNCNCHRPVMNVCVKSYSRLDNRLSPLVVNHYKGTYEQWSYRSNDGRKTRSEEIYYRDMNYVHDHDESARRWWPAFVEKVGPALALHLLQDAGRVVGRDITATKAVE